MLCPGPAHPAKQVMKHPIRTTFYLLLLIMLGVAGWFLQGAVALLWMHPTRADLAYGSQSSAQRLDLYMPDKGKGPFPVVVYVHGGAFMFGDKREPLMGFVNAVKRLNQAGIGLASINYRMSGEALFPAAVRDTRSSVRWLRAHAGELGIDPDRIAVWGKSAGANLALMTAVTDQAPKFDDPMIAPGVSSKVSAVIAMYPPTDFNRMDQQLLAGPCGAAAATHDGKDSPESLYVGMELIHNRRLADAASPINYIHAGLPPMMLQAGTKDCTVPAQQTATMAAALTKAGYHPDTTLIPDAQHGDEAFETEANQQRVIAFLKAHW